MPIARITVTAVSEALAVASTDLFDGNASGGAVDVGVYAPPPTAGLRW